MCYANSQEADFQKAQKHHAELEQNLAKYRIELDNTTDYDERGKIENMIADAKKGSTLVADRLYHHSLADFFCVCVAGAVRFRGHQAYHRRGKFCA